ncbi:MAG: glycosyltransferase family 2 protein [Rhodobacteraceae bacterium]|nr:glycosyltransferase family 2 protein [Paracoccaceae bacterium]
MTTDDPILSVVIPVYNRARGVACAIGSVLSSAAAAELPPGRIEIVVVDDGSTDGSAGAARAAGAAGAQQVATNVLRQANAGPAAARNLGAAMARAPHIAFVDSDDLWLDWTLPACLEAMAAHPEAALFFLKACVFTDDTPLAPVRGRREVVVHDGFVSAALAHGGRSFGTNNVIVRRDVFERLGGFAPEFRCLEDTDFFLRADTKGTCVVFECEDLLGRRRGHPDSLTDNWVHVVDGLEKMQRKESAGRYPHGAGGDPRRLFFLAGTAVRATRLCFASGETAAAYRVFFRNIAVMPRGGAARWLLRLPLTPLLSLLRPRSYPFRIRPAAET